MNKVSAECVVVHAGALGDFVMIWPLLRALSRQGRVARIVASASKARLAGLELGIGWEDLESAFWNELWVANGAHHVNEPALGTCGLLITFLADDSTPSGQTWLKNAARAAPSAEIVPIGPPGSDSRFGAWDRFGVAEFGDVSASGSHNGPVVLHVGAGSREKMWPMERWTELTARLRERGFAVELVAGEVEAERLADAERRALERLGGRWIGTLPELAGCLRSARMFIGADTGPTHLACQLGVPTIGLYGPTDPAIWSTTGGRMWIVTQGRVGRQAKFDFGARGDVHRSEPMIAITLDDVMHAVTDAL